MTLTVQDLYFTSAAAGTAITIIGGILSIPKVRTTLRAFRSNQDLAQQLAARDSADESKDLALRAAKEAADAAMQATEALKESQEILSRRVTRLEDQNRTVLFYYNLVLNYCSRLLDYIHEMRTLFNKHAPSVPLPDIPVQPAQMSDIRTKYADFETDMTNHPNRETPNA